MPNARKRKPLPPLLRFLAANLAIGVGAAGLFVACVIGFDIAGFRTLMMASGAPALPAIMLFAVLAITWGSAAMGTAVFLLPKEETPPRSGRRARPHPAAATVPVRAR